MGYILGLFFLIRIIFDILHFIRVEMNLRGKTIGGAMIGE